jgi:predicted nucleic acid-binding protein
VILIDSSVWIAALSARPPFRIEDLLDVTEIVTCLPVIQEVLQGFDDDFAFEMARDSLYAFPVIEAPLTTELFDEAIGIYRIARHRGITIRSSVDCLIAACAIRNRVAVLHRDRDFDHLARVSPLQSRRV